MGELIANSTDLITEILLRSPPSSIVNSFQLVSKQWHTASTTPNFTSKHTLQHPPSISGLFLYRAWMPPLLSHNYIVLEPTGEAHPPRKFIAALNSTGLEILQSCNGLLICHTSHSSYFICNPTTLQRKQLPLPKGVLIPYYFSLNLAFDPKKSTHYKVVCIRRLYKEQFRFQIEVYSSTTSQWKTSGTPFDEDTEIDEQGLFCNGAIHWLDYASCSCTYFDIDNECMKSTPEPPDERQFVSCWYKYFGQANGHLYLAVTRFSNLELYQMAEDYSGWILNYVIDLIDLSFEFPTFDIDMGIYGSMLVAIVGSRSGSNEDDDIQLVFSTSVDIFCYNPMTSSSKRIAIIPIHSPDTDPTLYINEFLVHEYHETLCHL